MRLSYILPCYNTEKYVRQCVESLYRQGLDESDFEVICINNATEDNLEEIIYSLMTLHSNIVYIKLETNICAGGAYNEGLKIARGEYIQFIDSDDYLKDAVMKRILNMAIKESLDVVYFNIESFKENNILTYENDLRFNGNFFNNISAGSGEYLIERFVLDKSYDKFPVPAYRKLIKKSLLIDNKILFTHTTIGTDFLHNLEILCVAKNVKADKERIYMFRYNPEGVTKSKMTSAKITYALNNYSKAYIKLQKSNFSKAIFDIISNELRDTINNYTLYAYYLRHNELEDVLNGLEYRDVILSLANDFINKMIVTHPKLLLFLSRTHMMPVLRKVRKLL